MIEYRHLYTLSLLRERHTLQAAAEQLHLTPSALSHQLKELEDQLGLPLFLRKSRPLVFTAAGQRLLALADKVLPLWQLAEADLQAERRGMAGRLHMALECHSCFDWLLPATEQFREHWPQVDLDVVSGFEFDALEALARHELDLVITSDPQTSPAIHYQPLFRYESVLLLPRDHALLQKQCIEPADLSSQTLVTYPVEENRLDIVREFLRPAGVRPAAIRQAALTAMLVQLVAAGRGVAALPNWVAADYLQRQLITSRPLGQGIWCTLYAAVRNSEQQRHYLQAFVEIIRRYCLTILTGVQAVAALVDTAD